MGHIKQLADVKTIAQRERETMTEEAREARRRYKREWNRRNKDKVKAAQARYWERRAQAEQEQEEAAGK